MPDSRIERSVAGFVVGVDEVGRGPLAGPVVAAAVVLDPRLPRSLARRIDDSKRLAPEERQALFALLPAHVRFAIGSATVAEIDCLNILKASHLAMARAVAGLGLAPSLVIVDGDRDPGLPHPTRCIVGGDGRCLSIAAASIFAKVTRDRAMTALAWRHPGYGWERNAGYGTPEHLTALKRLGLTPEHRRTFRPISEVLATTY
jgi:ribonuclease HII